MRWKDKFFLFFVNKVRTADGIFCSLRRTPIPFSFRPIGLISVPENTHPS